MQIVVQKFGGSSVATIEKVQHVAKLVAETARSGKAVVVVVSAMGKTTNQLIDAARGLNLSPNPRELDMLLSSGERISISLLAMALQRLGCDAVALTGDQCAIVTDDTHTNARILEVDPHRVVRELSEGRVVVVAGFQGVSRSGEYTTLGRGGSDTTAIAVAAALQAEYCDIYSDVDGIYTADPRVVPAARRMDKLDFSSMLELSRQGARVLNADAVKLARDANISIRARSTFKPEDLGTTVSLEAGTAPGVAAAVAGRQDLVRVCYDGSESTEPHDVLEAVAECDVIGGEADMLNRRIDLLVSSKNIPDSDEFAAHLGERFDESVDISTGLGSVAVVGNSLGDSTEMWLRAHRALEARQIPALTSRSNHGSITYLVDAPVVQSALRVFHETFLETAAA